MPDLRASADLPLASAGGRAWVVEREPAHTGGQALIHFARDPATGEAAALKVAIEPGVAGAWIDAERRLLRELAGAPSLADRVVPVIDHGTWGSRAYYAMPRYADTLASWIDRRPPLRERLQAALAVVEATRALHEVGGGDARYVHRDLKPTNVMRRDDGAWLLADFGAARTVTPDGTATTSAFHSRGFAPPEQGLPIPLRPVPEWDAFALAATAYYCAVGRPAVAPVTNGLCLTSLGRRALAGRDVGGAGPEELLDHRRMRALEDQDRRELAAVVGPALARAIEELLAPDPRRRRGTPATLADALRAEIERPGTGGRPAAALAGAAVALAALVGLAAWTALPSAPPPPAACPAGSAPEGERICVSASGVRMVRIPPGRSARRTEDGLGPILRFDRAFLIGETEVTQALWASVTGEEPVRVRRINAEGTLQYPCAGRLDGLVAPDAPVECVTYPEVVSFLNALSAREGLRPAYVAETSGAYRLDPRADGYRLPTDDEWAYAAAAGTTGELPGSGTPCEWGNVADTTLAAEVDAYRLELGLPAERMSAPPTEPCTDGYAGRAPVARFRPNAWGLYDVVGNVVELVGVAGAIDPADPATWPRGAGADPDGPPAELWRAFTDPDRVLPGLGLRLARTVDLAPEPAVRRVEVERLAPFDLAITEVSQAEWIATMGGLPSAGETCAVPDLGDDRPVVCVSWEDAVAYANARSTRDGLTPAYRRVGSVVTWDPEAPGWRLPTDAEWTAAAGAGRFAGTSNEAELCRFGNVSDQAALAAAPYERLACSDGFAGLAPVGSFLPNERQLFDLVGNAAEWTWDAPDGDPRIRSVRGGGHAGFPHDAAVPVATPYLTDRPFGLEITRREPWIGLRLARNAR